MSIKFKVVFEGKFKTEIPVSDVKQNLLTLYRGKQSVVNRFFEGKRLIIKKDIDEQTALKYKETFEKAGILCRIVKEGTYDSRPFPDEKSSRQSVQWASQRFSKTTESAASKEDSQQKEPDQVPFQGLSLREILAESWGRINGVKLELWGASLIVGILASIAILLGYGITFFLGEMGRNLYVVYGFQYAFEIFASPLLAGIIMLGVRRAMNETVHISKVFGYFTPQIIVLSIIISVFAYIVFALLLFMGVDHFYASGSIFLFVPIFALTVPLVIDKQLNPLKAISIFFKMFFRKFFMITTTYLTLFCIDIFGSFLIIGSIWTIPLFLVANGVLYRNLVKEGYAESDFREKRHVYARSLLSTPQPARKPMLKGSSSQNFLASVMLVLLLFSIGGRFWAMYQMRKIYAPDNVTSNGNTICVHFNRTLLFLTPDGKLQKSLELSSLGVNGEPADLELLEDGSVLIGDHENRTILHCDTSTLKCHKIGPAGEYKINDNFKFIADEKRNLLFIADTNNHCLLVQDMQGNNLKIIETKSHINYPNDMTLDKDGGLWISNTLHERILLFEIKENTITETGKTIKLDPLTTGITTLIQNLNVKKDSQELRDELKELKKDIKHTRPLALTWGADNNLWVAASDPYVSSGGVRIFSPDGKQIKSINQRKAIPEDIIQINNKFLVADTGQFQVFSILPESYYVSEFGDEQFQNEISRVHKKLKMYQLIKTSAGICLILLAAGTVILMFVIIRKKRSLKS